MRPIASGAPPNRRCQYPYPITATGGSSLSSSAVISRPAAGVTPSTLEVVPRGHLSEHLLDGSVHFHAQFVSRERGHSRKRGSLVSDAVEVRIGGAPPRPRSPAVRMKTRSCGSVTGNSRSSTVLQEADDRRVRTDADGQRQRDDRGEAGVVAKRAERVAQILAQVIEPTIDAGVRPSMTRHSCPRIRREEGPIRWQDSRPGVIASRATNPRVG